MKARRFCLRCAERGSRTASSIVGRIRPDESLHWDRLNWIALCNEHGDGTEKNSTAEEPFFPLTSRRALYSRKGITWAAARAWRSDSKKADIEWLKAAKASLDPRAIDGGADDVSRLAGDLFGALSGWTVSSTAVGHSRRPDSFAVRLAEGVAARLSLPFVKVFADRFVSGVSHPKEFRNLPPLQLQSGIGTPILLVDDVATSGWHMEEAANVLRPFGYPVFGSVWISGAVK
ncbi:phosphoribosyltransferase [Bradyrhizobium sp. WU425]|uniref:phosphoribosyltransferase n=1 Tax=Bradyrhizobium sp. WU425 TaxID=187029 RepID=UPI001E6073DD|nr:hypothetical protein [Bradyrhizobium canariense]UFW75494.1 hypothetical protein BcanWU425_17685 [Bradyrhizobium canariense]